MSAPLLFIASDRREAEPFTSTWTSSDPLRIPVHWARTGIWHGRDVIAVANGVGATHARSGITAALAATQGLSGISSIGTGGALDPSLAIAEIVVATSVNNSHALDPHGPPARAGLVHSSPHIARTREEKQNLSATGAILVEMEAAGVAQFAQELAVPFYCIRAVSDLANESFFTDFEAFLTPEGRFSTPRLALHALAHPVKGLGELLRLQRRSAAAARNLANYLDNCKF